MNLLRRIGRPRAAPTLASLDAYALWAAQYPPTAHNPLMAVEGQAISELLPNVSGAEAVDLAAGTGRFGLLLRERGARRVIALDNSPHMLAGSPLPFRVLSTMEAIPLASESVDILICGMAVGHLPRLGAVFAEIGRVLKAGGTALVSDFHPILHFTGARRTFNARGKTYAVEHYPHLYGDFHAAASAVRLRIDAVREPSLPGHAAGAPVALVLRLIAVK
ncbi:MAG: class I SAM-dependent methyltransferase [Anaerolineae bacterium]|nr:class I SAM-dependent methyltransferase [Anaerolineae bacterium]NUQ04464.1 class I SAM-dependent methyltransferase [Anaerolineae bacterium]